MLEPGVQTFLKADFLQGLTEEAIETIVAYAETISSPLSVIALLSNNGAATRVDPGATAFTHRTPHYHLFVISQWLEPAESDQHIHWTRAFWQATHRFAGIGVYVNELDQDDGDDRYRQHMALTTTV